MPLLNETGAEVAELLPDEVLAKSNSLPLKPAAVTLVGRHVKLVPIDLQRDNEALFAVSNGSAAELGERKIEIGRAHV